MELRSLNASELQKLLMEETQKLSSGAWNRWSVKERNEIRHRIDEIQNILEEKRYKASSAAVEQSPAPGDTGLQ